MVILEGWGRGQRIMGELWRILAYLLFALAYWLAASILSSAVERAEGLPRNPGVHSGLGRLREIYRLSPREVEVAAELVEGRSYKEIAAKLSISIQTLKTHVTHIYAKTSCPTRPALMLLLSEIARNQAMLPPEAKADRIGTESHKRPMAGDSGKDGSLG